ncbi:hypothetical protein [Lutibaculum baratangense]|nr:hypothetical protein [Lutibaculum baratangense]
MSRQMMKRRNSRGLGVPLALVLALAPCTAAAADLQGAPPVADIAWMEVEFSVGATYFDLPGRSLGRVGGGGGLADMSGDLGGWGPSFEFSLRRAVPAARWPIFLEARGFLAGVSVEDTVSMRPTGTRFVGATGPTTGGAFVDLAASSAPAASLAAASIRGVGASGDAGSIDSTVSTVEDFSANVSTTLLDGGVLNSLVLVDGRATPVATAIGASFTDRGLALAAVGDLSRVQVVSEYESDVTYLGGELRVGLDRQPVGAASVSPFAGIAWRGYRHEALTSTSLGFVPPPAADGAPALPAQSATIELDERVRGRYYGGSLGAEMAAPLTDRLSLEAGIAGSVFYLHADYRGGQRGILDTGLPAGSFAVSGPRLAEDEGRAAFAVALELGLAYRIGPGKLSLGGSIEYLSDVPSVAADGGASALASAPGGSAGSAGSLVTGTPERRLAFDDMTNFGLKVGYAASF